MAVAADELTRRAAQVRLLLLDVDGVLTNGTIYLDNHGVEAKGFNIMDGLGLNLLKRHGVAVGIITGRDSQVVAHRAGELAIDHVVQGCKDKLTAAEGLAAQLGLSMEQLAFAGDDLIDLRLLGHVGLAFSVANGVAEVQDVAHYVTRRPGGSGAVREMAELILRAQGRWDQVVDGYR